MDHIKWTTTVVPLFATLFRRMKILPWDPFSQPFRNFGVYIRCIYNDPYDMADMRNTMF